MSRKLIWFYTLLGCLAFCVTLLIAAPPLAMAPIGFTAIYMPALAGAFLLAWVFGRNKWVAVATCVSLGVFLTVGGSPIGALVAILFTLWVFWLHKWTNRKPPVQVTAGTPMFSPGYHLSYGHPVEQAARHMR